MSTTTPEPGDAGQAPGLTGAPAVFAPCARCGATTPQTCQKAEPQECLLLIKPNKRYVCRCCAAWVGDAHDQYCKLAQGVVTMAEATDKPLDCPGDAPSRVDEIGPSATSSLPLAQRHIFRNGLFDAFMALSDEDKRRMFVACAADAQDIVCMHSMRMSAVWPGVIPDLSMLVRQLAYALQHESPGHPLAQQAMDYLGDQKLLGHALPAAPTPGPSA